MNMKKSIAGVMAGAMAVSAMAASVSAVADQDSITLTYDLKEYAYHTTAGSATVVQYYATTQEPTYFLDDATATALKSNGYAAVVFGDKSGWAMTAKAIELSLSASSVNTGTVANVAWSYDADKGTSNAANIIVENGKTFNVPFSLGGYANTVDVSGFDYSNFDTTVTAGTEYAFNAITAKMTYSTEGWNDLVTINGYISCATTQFVDAATSGAVVEPTTFACTEAKLGNWEMDWVKPMQSQLKNPANVVAALGDTKENGSYYTNPTAVLNDAIANGSNVIFSFTSFNGDVYESEWTAGSPARADKAVRYETQKVNGTDTKGYYTFYGVSDHHKTGKKIWSNAAFDQHLYGSGTYGNYGFADNGQGGYDYFGSYSSAWGYNLFEGAIVVNSGITMQLNQADKFIWDNNTLTFDWDTITADGKVTNAKQFLSSMLLYTSTDWYWDSLEVTVEKDADENASAESPITEDEDVIDDEDLGEDDEIVADEETVETEATTAAVVEVPSTPNTGNASVALAVIPVALAAAAVVAKKRG